MRFLGVVNSFGRFGRICAETRLWILDELIQNTDCKGYPVIENFQSRQLVGFAGRAEVRYALGESRYPCNLSQ